MFEIQMDIARPVRDVFASLARVESAPSWYSAVTSVDRLDDGPVGRGRRFLFRRTLGSVEAVNDVEVTAFEVDQILEITSVSGPTPFVYRYELEPAHKGTHLRLLGTISGEGLGGPTALLRPFAEKLFQRGMSDNLNAFKRLVEAGSL